MSFPSLERLAVAWLLAGGGGMAAAQNVFLVDTFDDAPDVTPGDGLCDCGDEPPRCSLRAAVMEANALAGDDVIELTAGRYTLTILGASENAAATGDLDVTDTTGTLTIRGVDAVTTILDASACADRVLHVPGGATLVLEHVTLTGGEEGGGGGIQVLGGTVDIRQCYFEDNVAVGTFGRGGGFNQANGASVLRECEFRGNRAGLAGTAVELTGTGTAELIDCVFENNGTASDPRGAIVSIIDTTLVRCCFFGNYGGGLTYGGTLEAIDCEFSGNTYPGGGAGAVQCTPGSSGTFTDCRFIGNNGAGAGAVDNGGTVTFVECEFSANIGGTRGNGGAIWARGATYIERCTFSGNRAAFVGGHVACQNGTITRIVDSTLSDGGAIGTDIDGGGVWVWNQLAELINCTVSGNGDTRWGGGVYIESNADVKLLHCTVTNNVAGLGGGGIFNRGLLEMSHTIVAGNASLDGPDGADVGSVTSLGHNLVGDDASFVFTAAAGDLIGTSGATIDPLLGPLQDNGGPTLTHAPLPGSPAIDAGDNTGAPATDQRGVDRILDGNGDSVAVIDIGAVEVDETLIPNDPPTAVAGDDQSIHAGTLVTLDGGMSYDDNTATADLVFGWTLTEQPVGSAAALVGADTATPTFVADLPGTYRVDLVVTDDGGLSSAPDEVVVASTNLPPTADAGVDAAGVVGFTSGLDGTGSSDPEDDALGFDWTIVSRPGGSTAMLSDAGTDMPSFVPDAAGNYVLELVVSDPFADSVPDTVTVTVITGGDFAEDLLLETIAYVTGLPLTEVTTSGNQQAFVNFLLQAIGAIQDEDPEHACDRIDHAWERSDGCEERGAPDGNGPGRDWLTDCDDQMIVSSLLMLAQEAIDDCP